jgi:hypothetical protein
MSDNIDEILRLKAAEQSGSSGAPVTHTVISTFEESGFVAFIKFFAALTAALAFILVLFALANSDSAYTGTYWYLSLVGIGSAMSLFISAHVIKTIEKCAFYLENLNKKN